MRIIAGEKKGFKLHSLPGDRNRPTKDFVKEAIFSILFDCRGLKVLDLYSGCGSLGFEALSRGAESLDLVDMSEKAIRVMRKNLDKLDYTGYAKLHRAKVESFLRTSEQKFDLILADPPYNRNLINKTIKNVVQNDAWLDDGLLVIEHSSREKVDPEWEYLVSKQRRYGSTTVTFLTPNS